MQHKKLYNQAWASMGWLSPHGRRGPGMGVWGGVHSGVHSLWCQYPAEAEAGWTAHLAETRGRPLVPEGRGRDGWFIRPTAEVEYGRIDP